MEDRALIAFVLALALTAAVTPLVARLARRVGALDPVQERGLASEPTPLLGGLAILAGVLVAGSLLLAPAIVLGYAVRAAERDDREHGR